MPNRSTPYGLRYSGVFKDMLNGQTELYDDGVLTQTLAQANPTVAGALTVDGALTVTGIQTFTGIATHSAELRVAQGFNARLGTISAFATTEPTNSLVMKEGTEAVGAIATSAALSSSATVMRKVIAAGTASNVET